VFTISLDTPALARRQPTEAELKKFVLKSLGFDGFETDGLGLWDIFGAPGNSATGGTGYRDVEQIRGWNHTAILAKSLQFALASMSVFCSPEIADLVTGGGIEKYKAASRTSGIEHFQVPQDWVQAPREYRVSRLLRRPNPWTDESLFRFRMSQQIEAHGVCYVLVLPNEDGIPSQLYVIPKTSLTLLPPSTKMPRGGYRTAQLCRYLRSWNQNERPQSLQEMLSWLSNKDFDAKFVIPIGLPSFVWMDDFMNPSSAIADALDTDKEIHRSRRQTLQNQATNGPMFEEEAGYNLQTDERAQLLEEFHARNAGPGNSGKAFWKPKGVQIHNGAYSAREMEFSNSAVESRDAVMGQRMTPSAMVGLGDLTSYASVIGVLKAWSRMSGQPLMRLCAGQLTVGLQHFYDNEADREFMIVMQAGNIDDPETKAAERRLALESGTRLVKEWREEDNLEPFGDERDDAIVGTLQLQPPAGGEGAEGLAGMIGGGKPPMPGANGVDKGPAKPGIGAAVSGVPAAGSAAGGASQTEKSASALSDLTRAQFKRNRTAILETLDAVETGQMRPKRAKALLQAMGLSPQEADDLLMSVESPPEPEKTAQEQAASFFAKMFAKAAGADDCGANPDGHGFGAGNTCGNEKGEGKAAKSEKPAGKKKRRDIAKDPGQTVRGKTPEEVEEIKRRQRVAGRKAALRKRIEDAWKAAEEAGDDEDALLQRIQENIVLHSKRRLIDDEISLDEFETTHEQLLGKPVDQDEVASWGVKSAPERFDEAIDKAVQEHGVDWHQLRSVADQVWKHHAEFHRMREVGKKEARRITGVSLADVSRIENEGFDYSTVEGFDENARSFAIENPLIGIDPDDPADAVWQLIREPQRRPLPKYDQSIIDDAVGIIQRGEAVPVVAPPKLDIGGDDFVPAHERDDFVPDDELVTVGDDDDISWNFGKSVADMLFAKWTFIELATVKRSGCGANGPGGGGFQPGNTCGDEDGQESSDEH
jgi:hypothetical protein